MASVNAHRSEYSRLSAAHASALTALACVDGRPVRRVQEWLATALTDAAAGQELLVRAVVQPPSSGDLTQAYPVRVWRGAGASSAGLALGARSTSPAVSPEAGDEEPPAYELTVLSASLVEMMAACTAGRSAKAALACRELLPLPLLCDGLVRSLAICSPTSAEATAPDLQACHLGPHTSPHPHHRRSSAHALLPQPQPQSKP